MDIEIVQWSSLMHVLLVGPLHHWFRLLTTHNWDGFKDWWLVVPTSAAWIILVSLAPSPMANEIALILSCSVRKLHGALGWLTRIQRRTYFYQSHDISLYRRQWVSLFQKCDGKPSVLEILCTQLRMYISLPVQAIVAYSVLPWRIQVCDHQWPTQDSRPMPCGFVRNVNSPTTYPRWSCVLSEKIFYPRISIFLVILINNKNLHWSIQ